MRFELVGGRHLLGPIGRLEISAKQARVAWASEGGNSGSKSMSLIATATQWPGFLVRQAKMRTFWIEASSNPEFASPERASGRV